MQPARRQLGEWLGILGMSEYAERFAENDVDLPVLPHLTDHDLKELGVSLGHRRKMLAAIAERTGTVEASRRPTSTETKPPDTTAERRQVTVMGFVRRHALPEQQTGAEVLSGEVLQIKQIANFRVLSAMITMFGSATDCSRAARFGVKSVQRHRR
jgi:hypothetical protein